MQIRFDLPMETRRPTGKSQRFDVFGLKIGRPLTLFHRNTVNAWIGLECDPAVTYYCERPLLINDAPFKRLIDFYAIRNGEEEVLFVLTEAETQDMPVDDAFGPGFVNWCRLSEIAIKTVSPQATFGDPWATENWAQLLRDLAAFGRYVPVQLVDAIRHELTVPQTLTQLELLFPSVDPLLLKVALFSLLHKGVATCPSLASQPFSSALPFVVI